MKKIVLALALVMVLSSAAFAATTNSLSGYVQYKMEKVGSADPTWGYDYRLNFTGTVDEVSGYQVRFNYGDVVTGVTQDPTTGVVTSTKGAGLVANRYNFWTKLPFGKVVVGKAADNMTALNAYGWSGSDYMTMGYTGVGFYPTVSDEVKVFGFYDPSAKKAGAQAKFSADAFAVYGGVSKADADADAAFAVGGAYNGVENLSVYAQYNVKGDAKEPIVGGKYTVAGIDCVAEYLVESKEVTLDFTKTFQAIDLNVNYVKPDKADGTLSVGATLNF